MSLPSSLNDCSSHSQVFMNPTDKMIEAESWKDQAMQWTTSRTGFRFTVTNIREFLKIRLQITNYYAVD